jgi:hypothetical protein
MTSSVAGPPAARRVVVRGVRPNTMSQPGTDSSGRLDSWIGSRSVADAGTTQVSCAPRGAAAATTAARSSPGRYCRSMASAHAWATGTAWLASGTPFQMTWLAPSPRSRSRASKMYGRT